MRNVETAIKDMYGKYKALYEMMDFKEKDFKEVESMLRQEMIKVHNFYATNERMIQGLYFLKGIKGKGDSIVNTVLSHYESTLCE